MTCAAGEDRHVLEHRLAAVAEAGRLDGDRRERAADLVHDEGGERLALDVLGDDQQRLAGLHDLLEHGHEVVHGGDLRVDEEDSGSSRTASWRSGSVTKYGREVALVELHALGELELDAEGVRLLDGDGAVLADLVDGVGEHVADGGVGGRDGGDLGDLRLRVDLLGLLGDGLDGRATARSMPRLQDRSGSHRPPRCAGPRLMSAWASTVAVVVPSPATSLVLVATSFTSWAPMFSKGSSSSISLAMETPSLVIVGAPNFFSITTLRPFGPSVTLTVSASLLTPASRPRRAASSNLRILGMFLGDLGEHVAAGEDEQVLAVDGDLGAAVLRVDDGVADRHVERDELAGVLGATARADGQDLALLGLLLGGVGDDEAGGRGLLRLARADDDAVVEGVQTHGGPPWRR